MEHTPDPDWHRRPYEPADARWFGPIVTHGPERDPEDAERVAGGPGVPVPAERDGHD